SMDTLGSLCHAALMSHSSLRLMKSAACLLSVLLVPAGPAEGQGAFSSGGRLVAFEKPITFILLNSGASRTNLKSMEKEAVNKMQSAHLGNFGTQFDRGTLIAAGPLGDNGFIRGTVILAVDGSNQVAECFKTDPFVQNRILEVEAHPW